MEDQVIHLLYHAVIVPHQCSDFILTSRILYPLQRSLLYLVKRGAQLPKSAGKGFITVETMIIGRRRFITTKKIIRGTCFSKF